jgi:hypothetical protein
LLTAAIIEIQVSDPSAMRDLPAAFHGVPVVFHDFPFAAADPIDGFNPSGEQSICVTVKAIVGVEGAIGADGNGVGARADRDGRGPCAAATGVRSPLFERIGASR